MKRNTDLRALLVISGFILEILAMGIFSEKFIHSENHKKLFPKEEEPAQGVPAWKLDQNGPENHSIVIDNAIRERCKDPESYRFISATKWQKLAGSNTEWTATATYRAKNSFGGYTGRESINLIFHGCYEVQPVIESAPWNSINA